METIFTNIKNSKRNEPHKFKLTLADKFNLKNPNKNMVLANLSLYHKWKNSVSAYSNNKIETSAPTWNDKFDLLEWSYSISDIQDYIVHIIKKHETITDNPLVQIYVNKTKKQSCF